MGTLFKRMVKNIHYKGSLENMTGHNILKQNP